MLNDMQMEAINTKRRAAGKRPITTQILRQNPNLPAGVNADDFWIDYKMPGDIDPEPGKPITEYIDRAAFAAGVDGKTQSPAPVNLDDEGAGLPESDGPEYDKMTVDELKTEVEARKLDPGGAKLKADWIALLEADDKAKNPNT